MCSLIFRQRLKGLLQISGTLSLSGSFLVSIPAHKPQLFCLWTLLSSAQWSFFPWPACFSLLRTTVWSTCLWEKDKLTYLSPFFQWRQSSVDYSSLSESSFSYNFSSFLVLCSGKGKPRSGNFDIISNRNCSMDSYKIKIVCTWLVYLALWAWRLWSLICRQWL